MIQPIDSSEATDAARKQAASTNVAPATAAGKNFASMLAREKKAEGVRDAKGPDAPARDKLPIVTPDHEVWRPVRGDDHYARITEGPRAGMYVNLSRGARRGEVFRVEERDGKRVHVYEKNGKEIVIEAKKDSGYVPGNKRAHAADAPRNETWAPVKGANNYADILSGPRNGYFVNTSGGARDGMVFHVVRKGDKTYHVYGTGKNRQMIEVESPAKHGKKADASEVGASTGGVRAPSTGGMPGAS